MKNIENPIFPNPVTNPLLPLIHQGKVRDTRGVAGSPEELLITATDRVSAFDVVMDIRVPGKGQVLTAMTANWIRLLQNVGCLLHWTDKPTKNGCYHHLLRPDASALDRFALAHDERAHLEGRSMLVRRADFVLPIEFVVRGYLAGSGWKAYKKGDLVCGHRLPLGLMECGKLPVALFTPSTKAEPPAHDENIDQERMVVVLREFFAAKGIDLDPHAMTARLAELSLNIYETAAEYAWQHGIIIADTKFEFGLMKHEGGWRVMLIDEVLTPDSSRFWDRRTYRPGEPQDSFDKQGLRDYLEGEVQAGRWNKEPPPPAIDPAVLERLIERYREINRRLFA